MGFGFLHEGTQRLKENTNLRQLNKKDLKYRNELLKQTTGEGFLNEEAKASLVKEDSKKVKITKVWRKVKWVLIYTILITIVSLTVAYFFIL